MGGFTGTQRKIVLGTVPIIVLVVGIAVASVFPSASNQGYAPEQPIPFSHRLHAGDNKIACLYCHSGAERSQHASIPSLNVCMNCHTVVKTESPWIQKIQEHYKAGKPVEWVRIHELPDHAHFTHLPHVATAKISCQTCHGEVEKMDKVYQAAALDMGWCINCHRGETTPKHVLEAKYPDLPPRERRGKHVAPTGCFTCHY